MTINPNQYNVVKDSPAKPLEQFGKVEAGAERLTAEDARSEASKSAITLEQIEAVLDKLRPMLMSDGGNIELVEVKDSEVYVHLVGACGTCPSSTMTLKMGVERALKAEIPEIKSVIQI